MLWEELTQKGFTEAVKTSEGVCILPLGVLEKHGNHLPLGTDMFTGISVCKKAAEIEPAVVFPYYFFGQISEARHYKGTIAASHRLLMDALLEMCDEIHRNGFKKIIICSSHGGNNNFLPFFTQEMPRLNRPYNIYTYFVAHTTEEQRRKIMELSNNTDLGSHAGVGETSIIMHLRPELVDMGAQDPKEAICESKLAQINAKGGHTGFDWYAYAPYHIAGDPSASSPELGKLLFDCMCESLVELIKAVKADTVLENLINEFNQTSKNPM